MLLNLHAPQPSTSHEPTPRPLVEDYSNSEAESPATRPRTPTPPPASLESPPLTPVPEISETEELAPRLLYPFPDADADADAMEVDTKEPPPADPVFLEEHDQQPPPYSPTGAPSEGRRSASRVPSEPRAEIKVESRAPSLHPTRDPSVSVRASEEQPERTPSPLEERLNVDIDMEPTNDAGRKSATPAPRPPSAPRQNDDTAVVPSDELLTPEPPLPLARESHPAPMEYTLTMVPQSAPPSSFVFKEEAKAVVIEDTKPAGKPAPSALWKPPTYSLPPLSILPVEFHKKGKPKQSRKRDKEKSDGKSQEWASMGMAKWAAIIKANPVYKKMARASKCLSSRDWDVSHSVEARHGRVLIGLF